MRCRIAVRCRQLDILLLGVLLTRIERVPAIVIFWPRPHIAIRVGLISSNKQLFFAVAGKRAFDNRVAYFTSKNAIRAGQIFEISAGI